MGNINKCQVDERRIFATMEEFALFGVANPGKNVCGLVDGEVRKRMVHFDGGRIAEMPNDEVRFTETIPDDLRNLYIQNGYVVKGSMVDVENKSKLVPTGLK